MSFEVSLYLTSYYNYQFAYPVDSNRQGYDFLTELHGMSLEEAENWQPTWESLAMFDKVKFIEGLNNIECVKLSDSHQCREVAVSKGITYANMRSMLTPVYRNSYLTMESENPVPLGFTSVLTKALLSPYRVNTPDSGVTCDLRRSKFGIGMYLNEWRKPWLSLLSYFAKYGEFLEELAYSEFGTKDQYSLEEIVDVILQSWSGQVGFYTALGLWSFANNNQQVINGIGTYQGVQYNGIHSFMDDITCSYEPTLLTDFCSEFGLSLDRVSKRYLTLFRDRIERTSNHRIPWWFKNGQANNYYFADSPEFAEFMGWNEDEEEYHDDYEYDDDFDFEEGW
jgi:hypothetical protein